MLIKSQGGSDIINTDICNIGIEKHGEGMRSTWYIMAYGQDHKLRLGRYKNQKQAYHILDTIYDNLCSRVHHMSLEEMTE